MKKMSKSKVIIIVAAVILAICGVVDCFQIGNVERKKDNFIFTDTHGVIENVAAFEGTLSDFADKTGVRPVFVVAQGEDWADKYESLEAFAAQLFEDECEKTDILTVYCIKSEKEADQWLVSSVAGKKAANLLTKERIAAYEEQLKKHLGDKTKSVEEACSLAYAGFEYIEPGKGIFLKENWGFILAICESGAILLVAVSVLVDTKNKMQPKKAKKDKE